MRINELLNQKSMTKYRLAKSSGVPQTTVLDICSGKTKIEKCSAETVYKLAKALDVTVEGLLDLERRPSFEIFKSSICHKVKDMGDIDFIISTLESGEIRKLYQKQWYPESLYLLAMVDYLCRENELPICSEYNDIRKSRLREVVYPAGVVVRCVFAGNEIAKRESIECAIPEFMRFNIVENEVRNVC